MQSGTLDIKGLIGAGVKKALGHVQERTGLPVDDLMTPVVTDFAHGQLVKHGLESIELGGFESSFLALVAAGLDRQRKINEAQQQKEG